MALFRSRAARLLPKGARRLASEAPSPPYDVVIVGGGIVGCATAVRLQTVYPHMRLALVEKEDGLARHQSTNNSGVLHAGIYYAPGTLKARLCVRGIDLAYDYMDEHRVPYKRCGKLIVATSPVEVQRLEALFERATANKCRDIEMVDAERIKHIEPNAAGLRAIWSPYTGITDWGVFTQSLGELFQQRGGKIFTDFLVDEFRVRADDSLHIRAKDGRSVLAHHSVACAGLHSDRVARKCGADAEPKIVPFRGEYLLLKPDRRHLVNGNIYPVPDPSLPFLGVHFTPRMNGDVWLGPNAVLAFAREGYNYTTINWRDLLDAISFRGMQRLMLKHMFYGMGEMYRGVVKGAQVRQAQKLVPSVSVDDVTRGPSGVRAQALAADGTLVDDFVFDPGAGALAGRVLHVRNAPSPAATSSLAIAEMVADEAKAVFRL